MRFLHIEAAHADQHRYRRSPDAAGHAQQRRPNEARGGRRGVAAVDPDQGPGQHPPLARKGGLAGGTELIPSRTGGEVGMVIVDTTVWVDYFQGVENPETEWLNTELDRQRL